MDDTKTLLQYIRHELHRFPEVSNKEYETQKRIIAFLQQYSSAQITPIAKTGVLAIFNSDKKGQTILFRADIDALPIHEENTFKHKSTIKGVAHKCGHDGHTTILLGLAKKITETPIKTGSVVLLFQPAEENGTGAKNVLEHTFFKETNIDYVFALHNLPGFSKHQVIIKEHEFTANVISTSITLQGKTAHAAEPEKGINPAKAIAEILLFTEQESINTPHTQDFFLATPIYINMGTKSYGVAAGCGEIHLTLRSRSLKIIKQKKDDLQKLLKKLEKDENLQINTLWFEEFYSNKNNPDAIKHIKSAATKQQLKIKKIDHPFKWGEDFGLFTQKFKGAMFGLGAGKNTPALHNPDYDFPDKITLTGVDLFYTIVHEIQHT